MSKFSVGERVGKDNGRKFNPDDLPSYGVITDVLSDGRLVVKWDDKWRNSSNGNPSISAQYLFAEAELKSKYTELEQAFSAVENAVRDKMKEAGQMILDAQKVAAEAGFDLQELSEATAPLEGAMEKAGWNTSSWHC